MFGHWYIVASQKNMRVYVMEENEELRMVHLLENPLAQVRRHDLVKKTSGRGVKAAGRDFLVRFTETSRQDPLEQASLQFAKKINHFLEQERSARAYTSLSIAAEPHFLGQLRSTMRPIIMRSVRRWIRKDLQKVPVERLAFFLSPPRQFVTKPSQSASPESY